MPLLVASNEMLLRQLHVFLAYVNVRSDAGFRSLLARQSFKPLINHSDVVGRKLLLPSSAFNRREGRDAMSQMPGLDGDGAIL